MNLEKAVLAVKLANSILAPSALALIHAQENAVETLVSLSLVENEAQAKSIVNSVLEGTADLVQMLNKVRE